MEKCGIYCIKNLKNGKMYIGQSTNIINRISTHKRNIFKKNYPIYSDIRKIGIENFSFEIVEECEKENLDILEKKYIEKFNTYSEDGYNRTTGGNKGYKKEISEETKEKIRKTLTGKKINLSVEARNKKIEKFTGKNNINAKKVIFYDKEYETIKELSVFLKISQTLLRNYLNGIIGCEQYIVDGNLRYENKNSMCIPRKESPYSKKVFCEGKIFKNMKECADYYNINVGTLRSWFREGRKIRKDFQEKELKLL